MILEEFEAEKYERTIREEGIQCMVEVLQESGQSEDYTRKKLKEKYSLSEKKAGEKVKQYWKQTA